MKRNVIHKYYSKHRDSGDSSKHGYVPAFIRRFLLSWLTAVTTEYLLLPKQVQRLDSMAGLAEMSFFRTAAVAAITFILLCAGARWLHTEKVERFLFPGIFMMLAIISLNASFTWVFLGACGLIFMILLVYSIWGWDGRSQYVENHLMKNKTILGITIVFSAVFFLFISIWTVCRVYSFRTPTFDFGIFAQMFYNMKCTGIPDTTVERDGLLSHFQVHMSPIYYLLLPFYYLIPVPAALQVFQAAVITSAVIPLWKLAKLHGVSDLQSMFLCITLLLYPAFSGGTSYDIHENCFLTPLVLWLFYGVDRKNSGITTLSAVLILMVKEDAAIYVAVIGLWLIVKTLLEYPEQEKYLFTGCFLFISAVVCFFLTTHYLATSGDGVMTNRYSNFMYDGSSSLLTVIKSVILCPMKMLYECVDAEKLWFLAMTVLPVLGLPLLTRRFERYILLIPYILVNLMPDYPYQHDIFFQYTFGSTAFLFYLTMIDLSEWKVHRKKMAALLTAASISTICFCSVVVPKAIQYPADYLKNYDNYTQMQQQLSMIPENASVAATTFYTTNLSQREVLYDIRHSSTTHILSTEYVVLAVSDASSYQKYAVNDENGFENFVELLEQNGYEFVSQMEDLMVIYRRR